MGHAVKRNLCESWDSVDIWLLFAGAPPAPARGNGMVGWGSGEALWGRRLSCANVMALVDGASQCAFDAIAPATAPMTNHFMARPRRWRRVPPRASFRAASRSLPRAWVLVLSSARSAVAVARRV